MLRRIARAAYSHLWALPNLHRKYGTLSIAETFQKIYRTKAWGDSREPFCSGSGSRGPASEQYCEFVIKFVHDRGIQSIADLGCGDFSVGRNIVAACGVRYTGVDVVPELIEHHKVTVRDPRVRFQCADITADPLPPAELYLVRQVLQHLSNEEIVKALGNLSNALYVLISEDVPLSPKSFNRNKTHGPDVRSYWSSGVYVDQPPFSVRIAASWEIPLTCGTVLRTVLLNEVTRSKK